jgi:hypothetical protein
MFKKQLSIKDRDYRLRFKFLQIIETFHIVLQDLYDRFKSELNYDSIINDIDMIIDYFNQYSRILFKRYNRRSFTGIDKNTFKIQDIFIVINDPPSNYIKILQSYICHPSECKDYKSIPDWLDEEEKIYFKIYQYYYELVYFTDPQNNNILFYNKEMIEKITQNIDININIIKFDEIISSRISQKQRIEVLKFIGNMIFNSIEKLWNILILSRLYSNYYFKSILFNSCNGKITCSWIVPFFSNTLFSPFIFGKVLSIDLILQTPKYIQNMSFRNITGENDIIDDNIAMYKYNIEEYQNIHSMSYLLCEDLYHNIEKYKTILSNAQIWRIFYHKFKYWIFHIRLEKESCEEFIPTITQLYNLLKEDKSYTRHTIIDKEYHAIINYLNSN